VPGEQARETEFKEASTRLNAGLETCRVVVETYRELLGVEHPAAANEDGEPIASNDDDEEAAATG
jgi:hypothetical protein